MVAMVDAPMVMEQAPVAISEHAIATVWDGMGNLVRRKRAAWAPVHVAFGADKGPKPHL